MRSPSRNAPEIASGSGSCFSVEPEHGANALLDDQRRAEGEQQAVQRIAAVGPAQRELEQHAERADDHRREQQRDRVAPCRAAARDSRRAQARPESPGATTTSATYMPSAKNDPCARLIVSITLTISMKPSAISANSRPSARPLTRWGTQRQRASRRHACVCSHLVRRRRLVRLELAGLRRVRVHRRPSGRTA